MNDNDNFKAWKVRRFRTTVISMIQNFFLGLEEFAILTTLAYYLKEIGVYDTAFWYSVVLTSIAISKGISSLILGNFVDKTRKTRIIMLFTLFLSLLGNLMYILRYSVWLLVLGRLLCGIGEAAQSVQNNVV